MPTIALVLLAAAALGVVVIAVQHLALWRHLAGAPPAPRATPRASILKPLCGADDGLEENLASFAKLDYPEYEVLLGLRSRGDAAWPIALAAARRWPGRFRVVLQRGEPGLNPKVNQLATLAREARHDLLVVSDSNVRVDPGYLSEIAAFLEDDSIGLVTHPIAGEGELRVGSLMDHLHLAGSITPGVVAAKRIARQDIVVGKSMAFRRGDLRALGGFEAVKDVLAEDFVLGRMVSRELRKRVAVAHRPIRNVSERRTLGEFAGRYRRWAVMQRQAVGSIPYLAQVLLNPVFLATLAVLASPRAVTFGALAVTCAVKAGLDGAIARALRPGGFRLAQLALVPAKDLVFGAAWVHGLVRREVVWRGNRLRVARGTRLEPPRGAAPWEAGAPQPTA